MTTRIVCWNIAGRQKPWEQLVEMETDVALLQEALTPLSGIGTVAAGRVHPKDDTEPFVVVSMYARWMRPNPSVRTNFRVGYPDGSAHRIISDLSAFIGKVDASSHRIIAAGDLNSRKRQIGNSTTCSLHAAFTRA